MRQSIQIHIFNDTISSTTTAMINEPHSIAVFQRVHTKASICRRVPHTVIRSIIAFLMLTTYANICMFIYVCLYI